ncbi:MAG: hypothetical protein Kow0089_19980 [Desulfobulbaceae bacterium]
MKYPIAVLTALLLFAGILNADFVQGAPSPGVQVVLPERYDRTPKPLRQIRPSAVRDLGGRVVPLHPLPHRGTIREAPRPVPPQAAREELQPVFAAPMPAPLLSFEGTNNVNGVAPPDTCGDVGPDHYVQAVNLSYQVFDKTGNSLYGPVSLNTLWAGFGGICEIRNNGDPIVLYDQWADRWFISQFALDYGGAGFHQCIAVSRTGDPTGEWYRYDYKMSDTIMNDYPKFGVWPDGYYMSINQFDASAGYLWAGQGVAVFDRATMLAGGNAPMQYLDLNTVYPDLSAMLPADADGMAQPPPGEPNHFVMFTDDSWGGGFQDQLLMYDFHVDWGNPGNTTFLPAAALDTDPFTWFPGGIDQPDTTIKVASLGDRLMYRLQYRNFSTHRSMVVNHTVDNGSGTAAIRWYELRDDGTGWTIFQQGTHSPDATHRWMGSMAMDHQGNIGLGYSASNSTDVYPSIRYAGRLATDPPGALSRTETELHQGTGSQVESSWKRWGDYSMMSVDPVDDCTFWYTQEYYETTSSWGWQTRIGAFVFPECVSGPSAGSLSGTVTDGGGTPLAGVLVEVSDGGSSTWSTVSGSDGTYVFSALPAPATYGVTATRFGYAPQTVAGVDVSVGSATLLDFALVQLPVHTLSGTVTDGSTGWPLYARIDYGHGTAWTDPLTGFYSVDLPEGGFDLTVSGSVAGYDPATRSITLDTDRTEDFQLVVDPALCDAQGYRFVAPLVQEFTRCELSGGWSVKNNGGDCVWRFDDPGYVGNLTGGAGCFAIADSDFCGDGTTMDTELTSPSFDATGLSSLVLEFKYDVRRYYTATRFEVDLSTDGGTTWTNVWQRLGVDDRGPQTAVVDISALADGQPDVRIRFHHTAPGWDWWWQVDDVYVYEAPRDPADLTTCIIPAEGGFVYGNIYDDNTGLPLNGAEVTDGAGHHAQAVPTPDDDNLDDAFFALFLPASGSASLSASIARPQGYGTDSGTVTVPPLGTVKKDFRLPAALFSPTPDPVEIYIRPGDTRDVTLALDNTGAVPGTFSLFEVEGPVPARANGPFAVRTRHMSPKHLEDVDPTYARYDYPGLAALPVSPAAGEVLGTWASGLAFPWGTGYDRGAGTVWLGNLSVMGGDDRDHEFAPDGTPTGRVLDVSTIPQVFMADMAYDPVHRTLWQVNVGGGNCVHELDPATLALTGETICPGFGLSQRGLAYNVKTDTFYAGSWNDSTVYEFDRAGTILRSVDVGLPISGLAFNPVTDHLFVMNNTTYPFHMAVLDVLSDFSPLFAFAVPGFSSEGGAGLAMDEQGGLWGVDQKTGTVYHFDSGEGATTPDIPWLTVSPLNGSVGPGAGENVTLRFDSTDLTLGSIMEGYLVLHDDSPYPARFLPVTMHVLDLPVIVAATSGEITKKSATITAEVDPRCHSTEYYFEYSTTPGVYDQRTGSLFSSSCTPVSLDFLLSGLAKGTTYYGRLVAVNIIGTSYSTPLVFTTDKFPWLLLAPALSHPGITPGGR